MTDSPSRDLAMLADRYWQATLAFHPIFATYLGDRQFDDRLDDYSDAAIDGQRATLAAIAQDVEGVQRDDLGVEDRITRSALLAQIRQDTRRNWTRTWRRGRSILSMARRSWP